MRLAPLLLVSLLAGCGYVFGTAEGEPVPDPVFRLLRLDADLAAPRDRDRPAVTVLIHADGRIRMRGMTMSERQLGEYLWTISEMWREVEAPPPAPSLVFLGVVPDARARWSALRPVLRAAADPDVRFRDGLLVGDSGESRDVSELPFLVSRGNGRPGRWTAWGGGAPRWFVGLTANAVGGVDAEAIARRVGEGPVLLSAADEVPAQVVADALAALLRAGAGPVMLSPDPPGTDAPESLPGVVIW